MSDDNGEAKRLTIDDPVSPEALKQLAALHTARGDLCERNAQLDQEKIGILAALKRIEAQKQTIFEALLTERGLAPDTEVSINPKTGAMQRLQRQADGSFTVTPAPPPADS